MRTARKKRFSLILALLMVLSLFSGMGAANANDVVTAAESVSTDSVHTASDSVLFNFKSSGIQAVSNNFKNGIYVNNGFDHYISSDSIEQSVELKPELMLPGKKNTISITIGNVAGDYKDDVAPKDANYDDFSVFGFSVTLPNGETVVPADVKLYYAVDAAVPAKDNHNIVEKAYAATEKYEMGDGFPGGSNLTLAYRIDIQFDLTSWGQNNDTEYTWNLKDEDIFKDAFYVSAASKTGIENLSLTVDGEKVEGLGSKGTVYFDFKSSGIQSVSNNFKNGIYVNNQFDHFIASDDTAQRLELNSDLMLPGQKNTVSITVGNESGDYKDHIAPKDVNYDDFSVFSFSVTLPTGETIVPANVKLYYAVDAAIPAKDKNNIVDKAYSETEKYAMGDGFPGGSNLSYAYRIDIQFDLTSWDDKSKLFKVDTTKLADGNHVVQLWDNEIAVKSAAIVTDNTAPVVTPSVDEGETINFNAGIDASIEDATSGVASTTVSLDGNIIELPYASALSAGIHTLTITAADKAGNTATKSVVFRVASTALSVENPRSVWDGNDAKLSITPIVPGEGTAAVSFYKATNIAVEGYANAVDSTVLNQKSYAGEKAIGPKVDGYVTTSSVTGMPYQVYDAEVEATAGDVILSFTGHTLGSERLALAAWNNAAGKWVKIASGSGINGSDFTLTGTVKAAEFVTGGKLRAMIMPDIVANGSDTIGWLTDTQYYTQRQELIDDESYKKMTEWLKGQFTENKIGYVIHTGDIVESVRIESEWRLADQAQKVLDDAGVPNGVLTGNHDVGSYPSLNYDLYSKYFGEDRYKDQPWYGGSFDNNANHYDLVTIGGKDLIFLYLGMGIEVTPQTVAWANGVLKEYSHRTAIIGVHQYLATNGDFDTAQRGQKVFEQIVAPSENVVLVLCGHNPGVARNIRQVPNTSRNVVEILSDYQHYGRGGDGLMRTLQITDGKLINKTYSPITNKNYAFSLAQENFEVELPLKDPNRTISTASFTVGVAHKEQIGDTVSVQSGETATVTWTSPSSGDTGWYAAVSAINESLTTPVYPLSNDTVPAEPNKVPKQVTVSVTATPDTSVIVNWTTVDTMIGDNVLQVVEKGKNFSDSAMKQFSSAYAEKSVSSGSVAKKTFYTALAEGLTPNTDYIFRVGNKDSGAWTRGSFKTALAAGAKDSFTFNYLTDPQVDNASDAKAASASFNYVKALGNPFTYVAGDFTNSASHEGQWEMFFNGAGAMPDGGANLFGNNLMAGVTGNHDAYSGALLNNHFGLPSTINGSTQVAGVENVYAFDYGMAHFVAINTEVTSGSNLTKQMEFVSKEVEKAKAAGQWAIIILHKAIYTGASHITDTDIKDLRKAWSPLFAELGVDAVLQGHDHVFSRGFVNADGENAKPEMVDAATAQQPQNAPFYIVGGHGGGLKWYSTKNYTVEAGDPLTANYDFLDLNSAKPAGDRMNPNGPQSSSAKETNYITVTVTPNQLIFNTYMFKYDQATDKITKQPYLYDTYTVQRETEWDNEQEPPTGLAGIAPTAADKQDGKITGTTIEMEYKLSTDTEWKAVTGVEIIGLASGAYEVRYAAKAGYEASEPVLVIVPAYTTDTALTIGAENRGGAGYTRTISIDSAEDLSDKYLVVQFTEGTGANAKVSVVMVSVTGSDVTVSYQSSGTKVDAWLVSGMPDLAGEDMKVQVNGHAVAN